MNKKRGGYITFKQEYNKSKEQLAYKAIKKILKINLL
mgnify:CR=1 FL=1